MPQSGIGRIVEDARLNATLAWALVGFVLLVAAGSLLQGDLLWTGFAVTVAVLAALPAAAFRSARVMLPWEVLALAALPLLGRTFAVAAGLGTGRVATYLGVAAIALMIAVELDVFTAVEMSYGFAVFFVVVATMAAAGIWAIVRWVPDVLLGTQFLLEPGVPEEEIEHRLMLDFVASTAAGVLAGVVFQVYFRRRARIETRVADLDPDLNPASDPDGGDDREVA